jgi:hypothetical protein
VADSIVNAQPVKAEMSVAAPKSQAREPIQLNVILVCRKRSFDPRRPEPSAAALASAFAKAVAKAARLASRGLELSRNDRRVILYSQFLAELGPVDHTAEVLQALAEQQPNLETALDEHFLCNPADPGKDAGRISDPGFVQRLLFE